MSNLPEMANELRTLTDTIAMHNNSLKPLKARKAELEMEMIKAFDDMGEGMDQIRTNAGTVGVRELVVGNVDNWEDFYDYVYDNKAFHMLERRIANVAYREMLEQEQEVPGVEPFTKRSISLTKGKNV